MYTPEKTIYRNYCKVASLFYKDSEAVASRAVSHFEWVKFIQQIFVIKTNKHFIITKLMLLWTAIWM